MYIKNTLYVGVDVSLKSLTTCILDTLGSVIFKPATFSNNPYCFTPKLINNFKKSIGNLPKNDKSDSFVIAHKSKSGHLPDECYINFKQLALQRLTRFRKHTMDSITREKGYLTFYLYLFSFILSLISI